MPDEQRISDDLLLAAIQRAERQTAAPPGVPIWSVYDHLSIVKRSRRAKRVRAQLGALETAGSLERGRRHGVQTWALTSTGRRRLARARRAGEVPELPESPQHRTWRNARSAAEQEIDRFLHDVRAGLDEAMRLLDSDPAASSDAWLALGERLHHACRRVGFATYCSREWSEPDDTRADTDDHRDPADEQYDPDERVKRRARRAGRRNIRNWTDMPALHTAEQRRALLALGQTISQLRIERNMSAAELAGAAGITPERLADLEDGQLDPEYELMCKLADALNVTLTELVGDATDREER